MTRSLTQKVQRFYDEAWNERRFGVVDELFAPEYADHDAIGHTGMDGRASARAFIELYRAAIPDLQLEIRDQIGEGDKVVTRWFATGTHKGPLMGLAPTEREIGIDGISIDRFDSEGRFVEGWGTWDGIGLLRQLGALPTPGA